MIYYDPRWSGQHGVGRFSAEIVQRLGTVSPLHVGVPKVSLLDPIATTLALRHLRSGVYFTPGFNAPLRSPIPHVFTVHDLIYLRFPAESTIVRRAYYRLVVKPATRHAYRVLTDSQHSRGEILEWSGLPPERVSVVGLGVAPIFCPEGEVHRPGYPYFLFVGRREAHKNLMRLLSAYARSRSRRAVKLVLSGEADRESYSAVQRFGLSESVLYAGPLSDAELAAYYRGALALAWPSLYEGFGLPIVEAMACATPVLTSCVTAMPETAGEGNALLVDPMDEDAIMAALDSLAEDAALREHLRSRGLLRAKKFCWDDVAAKVASILAEACDRG